MSASAKSLEQPLSDKYLSRIDNRNRYMAGWQVRIRLDGEREVSRLFSDGEYGGREPAKTAARDWRDQYLSRQGLTNYLESEQRSRGGYRSRADNTSGIIGIQKQSRHETTGTVWVATYREDGQLKRKAFSESKHGPEGAFKAACRVRYEKTGELLQQDPDPDWPCEPGVPLTPAFPERY